MTGMISPEFLQKRPDWVSAGTVMGHMVSVFAPVYIAAVMGPGWVMLPLWLWFGLSMNGILNLLHECAHSHVFSSKRRSERLGRFLIAPLAFADFVAYKQRHWDHHRFLGVNGETKDTYVVDIRGNAILRLALRCLFGAEAIRKFSKQSQTKGALERRTYDWLLITAAVQLVFVSSLVMTARVLSTSWSFAAWSAVAAYTAIYLYGLMSLTVFMATLRAIAEHQPADDSAPIAGIAALRNFSCGHLSRYLMGAYGFGEHYTHHRYPAIPYYRLGAATEALGRADRSLVPSNNYFDTLKRIIVGQTSLPRNAE
jgi:fatty acid desaturase